jgi:PPOX class probable F420-dependent enzyme
VAVSNVDSTHLQGARVGLLTTYRRNGEPVATLVSIAVRAGGVYFLTSAASGKARRLTVRSEVSLAPSTVRGTVTGPAVQGRARLLNKAGRRRARRLLLPGGPLFWSYLLYRMRGHRMQVYEVTYAEPGQRPPPLTTQPPR